MSDYTLHLVDGQVHNGPGDTCHRCHLFEHEFIGTPGEEARCYHCGFTNNAGKHLSSQPKPPLDLEAIKQDLRDLLDVAMRKGDWETAAKFMRKFAGCIDALIAEVEQLRAELGDSRSIVVLAVALIDDRNRVLDLIPCPVHGRCVPYALEVITNRLRVDPARVTHG